MTDTPWHARTGVDTSTPNVARMNDYYLGGKDNFAADREAAEQVLAVAPEIKEMAEEARYFVGRVVRYLTAQGIRQFIDIGAGLPTQRNTHEVARSQIPDARVVYVDNDPVVLSHARAILVDSENTAVLEGDINRPAEILADSRETGLIDFEQPLAVLIFTALHFIPHSDDPFKSVAWMRDALPDGSHLAISHVVFDTRPDAVDPIEDIYRIALSRPGENAARTRDEVVPFFDGFELADPGLVDIHQWRPDKPLKERLPKKVWMVGGVGRKI